LSKEYFVAEVKGTFEIKKAGKYTFNLKVDD